jgi:hypothetical protein
LHRRRADLFRCRRRFEVVQSLDVSTHSIYYGPPNQFPRQYNAALHPRPTKPDGQPAPSTPVDTQEVVEFSL